MTARVAEAMYSLESYSAYMQARCVGVDPAGDLGNWGTKRFGTELTATGEVRCTRVFLNCYGERTAP